MLWADEHNSTWWILPPDNANGMETWVEYSLKWGMVQFGEWDVKRGMLVSEGIIR